MHVHTQEGVGVLPTGYGAPSGDDDDAAAEMDARAPMMRTPPVHHGVSTSGRDLSVIQGFPPKIPATIHAHLLGILEQEYNVMGPRCIYYPRRARGRERRPCRRSKWFRAGAMHKNKTRQSGSSACSTDNIPLKVIL